MLSVIDSFFAVASNVGLRYKLDLVLSVLLVSSFAIILLRMAERAASLSLSLHSYTRAFDLFVWFDSLLLLSFKKSSHYEKWRNWREALTFSAVWIRHWSTWSCARMTLCSVSLPHCAVGWSVICDCDVPSHTHLLFLLMALYNLKK